ncbi:MAG TPA: LysR substrate-binding domain-containing protein [Terriglobales bacterium]|nr:LysR substrate-binding domain-containing protein [Terriglobales bacterium]
MELLELRYLDEVADAGSFSKASIRIGITQPALSRQIAKLEQELKTQLFYRHGRGVALTPAGLKLREVARPILNQLSELKREIVEQSAGAVGQVSFGVPPSLGATLVAPLVRRFRAAYPNATLRVYEAFSSTVLEWVESGRLDLAVLYDSRRSPGLIVSPLLLEDLFFIEAADAGPEAPATLTLDALIETPLILPGPENGLRRVIARAAERAGISLEVMLELDSVSAITQLVESGLGKTILPYGAVHKAVREGRVKATPFASESMRAKLVTATPLSRPVSKATQALLGLINAEVQQCVEEGLLRGVTVQQEF